MFFFFSDDKRGRHYSNKEGSNIYQYKVENDVHSNLLFLFMLNLKLKKIVLNC